MPTLTLKKLLPLLLLTSLAATTQPSTSQPAPQTDTPENALRSFLKAIALNNPTLGNAVTLPMEGSDLLYQNTITPEQTALTLHAIDTLPIKRFKLGDTYTLPGPRHLTITFDENFINENKQQLLPQDAPFPVNIERQPDGRWLADPSGLIASRRAAARQRATTKPQQ